MKIKFYSPFILPHIDKIRKWKVLSNFYFFKRKSPSYPLRYFHASKNLSVVVSSEGLVTIIHDLQARLFEPIVDSFGVPCF